MAEPSDPGSPQLPTLGSYQVIRPLGAGGMSNVFQAVHRESGSLVALKVLPRRLAQNPVLLQRFLKEAKSAESLDHPNIVAIYDRGNDEGRHYLVLEFVDGRDLFDYVRSQGPLDTATAVRVMREVAEGLRYASQRGMVHRDIKPANLLLTTEGQAKIIDLGLALQTIDEDERVTRQGTTVGTVDYMSPEQARDSRKINEASDIYSLGCTLFYLVTGTPPFAGGTLADKLARHHSAAIPNARDRNPAISADLAGLIEQMMAKQPADRPAGYDDLLAQLDRIARGEPRLPAAAPLDVLIDDEDDSDDAIELTLAGPSPSSTSPGPNPIRRGSSPAPVSAPPELSLADLAAIDAESTVDDRPRRRKPKPESVEPALPVALLDEEDEPEYVSGSTRRPGPELPLRTWIVAGVGVGLALALVGVGLTFLVSTLRSGPPTTNLNSTPVVRQIPEVEESPPEVSGSSGTPAVVPAPDRPNPRPTPAVVATPVVPVPQPDPAAPGPAVALREADLTRWGFAPDPPPLAVAEGTAIRVRRFAEAGEQIIDSLANALGRPGSLVEIADAGPVREDHFEMAGRTKIIRGRGGYHPILRIDSDYQSSGKSEAAKFVLGGSGFERLVLQDLDLVVDLRDLPPNQSTLFLCQGVELNLVHCSVTVHNAADRDGFSLIRTTNGPRPNRIRLDRCLIRGPVPALIDVQSDQTDLDVRRSVVVGAGGPLLRLGASARPDRTLRTLHAVLVTSGALLDAPTRPDRFRWRSLGSTLIHCDQSVPGAVVEPRSRPNENFDWIDFDGGANRWTGWAAIPSTPEEVKGAPSPGGPAPLVSSRDSKPSPLTLLSERIQAIDFQSALTGPKLDLGSVAVAQHSLYEETVDLFPRLNLDPPVASGVRPPVGDLPPGVSLTFDMRNAPEDLGVFLAKQITDPAQRYEVRIDGVGVHRMTPVRLPEGINVRLIGPAPNGTAPLAIQLVPNRPAEALIALGRGNLALENLGLLIDESTPSEAAIASEGGTVSARTCSIRGRTVEEGLGQLPLIQIRNLARTPDRPLLNLENCWIWTNRPAVALELRQGVTQLKNCVVLAGRSAFRIRTPDDPSGADPLPLLGDLSLENCTILAERFAVDVADLGSPTDQPARPFLVWSRACAFPRSWREQGILLALDRERFARGNLFWESSNDIYDVSRLLGDARGEGGLIPPADIRRHWAEVWGANHVRGDRGPDPRKPDRPLTFKEGPRGRTTKPTLGQLELDPKLHRGLGANFAQLPAVPRS